jgi:hypothetical protein
MTHIPTFALYAGLERHEHDTKGQTRLTTFFFVGMPDMRGAASRLFPTTHFRGESSFETEGAFKPRFTFDEELQRAGHNRNSK